MCNRDRETALSSSRGKKVTLLIDPRNPYARARARVRFAAGIFSIFSSPHAEIVHVTTPGKESYASRKKSI